MANNDDLESLPRNIRWEIINIRNFDAVDESSVEFFNNQNNNEFKISFKIFIDKLLNPKAGNSDIKDIEPVSLVYKSTQTVGKFTPKVFSNRNDFPRNIQHLNPTPDYLPASFCLSRSGTEEIYSRFGIWGILERLVQWLSDAKTGEINKFGWELIPHNNNNSILGTIDGKVFQELAMMNQDQNYSFFEAQVLTLHNDTLHVRVQENWHIERECLNQSRNVISIAEAKETFNNHKDRNYIPGIFCWNSFSTPENSSMFSSWCDVYTLKEGLNDLNILDSLEEALISLDPLFSGNQHSGEMEKLHDMFQSNRKGIVLCIGLWRPEKMDPTIQGLSNDDIARRLELRFYLIARDSHVKDPLDNQVEMFEIMSCSPPSLENYTEISGEAPLRNTTFIGAGSLGSKLMVSAARGGIKKVSIIDKDVILPHNIARHEATQLSLAMHKAIFMGQLLKNIHPLIEVEKYNDNIFDLEHELIQILSKQEQVIDSTANPRISHLLSALNGPEIPIMKTEIFNKGKLGMALFTSIGSPHNLSVLHYQVIALASNSEDFECISEWLKYETSRNYIDEEILLGFGCTSSTTKMPDYKIDSHAAAICSAAKKIFKEGSKPTIFLNSIDENGLPQGSNIIEVPEIKVFHSSDTSGWKVIVSNEVIKKMHEYRKIHAPLEAGGYVYGAINEPLNEIYLLKIFDSTNLSSSTRTGIELCPFGQTEKEKAFLRRTRNRLIPIGSWHSHPQSAPNPSQTDILTFNRFILQDMKRAMPTLMVISGASEDRIFVEDSYS